MTLEALNMDVNSDILLFDDILLLILSADS